MFILAPWKLTIEDSYSHRGPTANILLIVLTVACYALGVHHPVHRYGSPSSLLLYGFSHAGLWHLLANMWLLWLFGTPINRRLGNSLFVAIYLGTILFLGALARFCILAPVVGASGAVYAMIAVCILLEPRASLHLLCLAIFPLTAIIGLFAPPASTSQWLLRWRHMRVPLINGLLAIPLLVLAELFTFGWNWSTPAHLLGLGCGFAAVLLLPTKLTMRPRQLTTI